MVDGTKTRSLLVQKLLAYFYYVILTLALKLRYRLTIKGLKGIKSASFNPEKGILFLANHPAEIDPCILLKVLWPQFQPKPVASEHLYHSSIVRYLLNFVGTLPIPNFDTSTNSYKKKRVEKVYGELFDLLNTKQNILIYPSGGLKRGRDEVIGGASGVHTILQEMADVNIVLVRTKGLWGSSFSRAQTGKSPDVLSAFIHGLKVILKNGIFFAPRRQVHIECQLAPKDLPRTASKLELNRFLEKWYNRGKPDALKLVSYAFWKKELPKIVRAKKESGGSIKRVPKEVQALILDELALLTHLPRKKIVPELDLATDLGLDSLDLSQMMLVLKENFGVTTLHISDLTTVGSLMLFAAHLKQSMQPEEPEPKKESRRWQREKNRPAIQAPDGNNIVEIFFETCARMDVFFACADLISGEVQYKQLRRAVTALALAIEKMPGKKIGLMLPSTVGANVLVLATMLAGKVPVMINWTLGARNIRSVVEQTKIGATLTSWTFVDRLENVQLDGVDDQIVLLEDVRRNLGLLTKLKTFCLCHLPYRWTLRRFGAHKIKPRDPAVILFTSGTENLPKGVPLSHKNILSNLRGAYDYVDMHSDDVLLGFLPPFHSFGFSVTGLFPLLAGMRAVYSPNPTDGKRLCSAMARWQVTVFCSAPTFLKTILRAATKEQLQTLRLVVVGAEKSAPEIYEKFAELNPKARLLEGYGITECSPILTLNPCYTNHPRGVGLPLPGVLLKVVHPESRKPIASGKTGLVLAHGTSVFYGYLDKKIRSPFVEMDGKKWYETGDLGFLDEEGYLTLAGRLKRFVKIGGEMVSLGAIEEVLVEVAVASGWMDPEIPSLAICAKELAGKKTTLHLFTTFLVEKGVVNEELKKSGMSNLIKVASVVKVPFLPLLGSGKINYRKLGDRIKDKS